MRPEHGRPVTGRGVGAARPAGAYDPPTPPLGSLEVDFFGEDGRIGRFSFARLPLPGLAADLAVAFARHVGPGGGVRTHAAATTEWGMLARLVRFLAGLRRPPRAAADLTVEHLRHYRRHLANSCTLRTVAFELQGVSRLLRRIEDRLAAEVVAEIRRPGPRVNRTGQPGYSDQEFWQIMTAARGDVAAIRDRIRRGEQLAATAIAEAIGQPSATPSASQPSQATVGTVEMAAMACTGVVPARLLRLADSGRGSLVFDSRGTLELARLLFLTDADLAPLLILGVGVTGRNVETLKELPAAHQILDGRAVAIEVTKRRRGPGRIRDLVHWEIGPPSRQLHAPGGYYLLLHELTRRSRACSKTGSIWSIWAAGRGQHDPFERRLSRNLHLDRWARRHQLRGDDQQPLRLTLNRLRTTVEVRTTKAVG